MHRGDDVELRMVRKRQDSSPDWGLFAPASRASDPETSKQGERDVRPRRGTQAMRLLQAYYDISKTLGGTSDEGAARFAGLNNGGWKRCSDLRRAGLIEPTGEVVLSQYGSSVQVCRITAAGIAHLAEAK